MNIKRMISPLILMVMSGCAQYRWEKTGGSQTDFDSDKYVCERDATMIYPVKMIDVKTADQVLPGTTTCLSNGSGNVYGGHISTNTTVTCTATPPKVVSGVTVFRRDENLKGRGALIDSCLRSRGWSLIRYK